jgi:methionyl-tRNA formyltransferase
MPHFAIFLTMKVIFMGTPDFAVPALKKIFTAKNHELLFVITQPDKKTGRKQILTAPSIKNFAIENNIEFFQPENINKDLELLEKIKTIKPDLMITVAYGQILKQEILDIAPIVNLHASLLPLYRGPAPINWSLINGDRKVGVTTMLTAKGVDTGDMLLKSSIEIDDYINSNELTDLLADLGADLLIKTLDEFPLLKAEKQKTIEDPALQYAPFMDKNLGLINFSQEFLVLKSANPKQDYFLNKKINSAKNIHNLVRGLQPWPGVSFDFKEQKIILLETDFSEIDDSASPGKIIEINKQEKSFYVATQKGALIIKRLKPQGKKELDALDWLNGQRLKLGDSM